MLTSPPATMTAPQGMDVRRTAPRRRQKLWVAAAVTVAALGGATALLGRLRAALPEVERDTIFVGTVKRGELVRQVQAPGLLVPEQIRWVSAVSAARVEQVLLRPGARVEADTVLLELNNPELQLQALEAERQLASAQAELVNLITSRTSQELSQQAAIATLGAELLQLRRKADADGKLEQQGIIPPLELLQLRTTLEGHAARLLLEERRLRAMRDGGAAQVAAQRAQIERLRSIAQFRAGQLAALQVRAGVPGVLQELTLQAGQWVAPGTLLAKVAQPERLKAELRVAETQAKDVQVGQKASIDTRDGIVAGRVSRIDPAVSGGSVKVEVLLDGELPQGARPDLSVDGVVELERLPDVLHLPRPAFAQADSTVTLFKLGADGAHAVKTRVQLGRASVQAVELRGGLREGDQVILSDMSQWDFTEGVTLR